MIPRLKDDVLRHLTVEVYDDAFSFIAKYLEKNFQGYSFYRFGHCRFPGISDIDMLVVLDCADSVSKFRHVWGDLREKVNYGSYLFWHAPIVISHDDLPLLRLFHTAENPVYISGNKITIDGEFGVAQILIWNSYFYKAFFDFLDLTEVNLRYAHLLLNCMGYSVKNNDRIYGTNFYLDFSDTISKLRGDELKGLNSSDSRELIQCFKAGLKIIELQENNQISRVWPWHRGYVLGPECSYKLGSSFKYCKKNEKRIFIYPRRYFDLYNGFLVDHHRCVYAENQQYLDTLKKSLIGVDREYKDLVEAFVAVGIFDNNICRVRST